MSAMVGTAVYAGAYRCALEETTVSGSEVADEVVVPQSDELLPEEAAAVS